MEAALYDGEDGYYTAGRRIWGGDGDYLTAPGVHPALGYSVARLATEIDGALGRPDPFDLVEVGCGDGRLAAAALSTLRETASDLWSRLRVTLVDRGADARRRAAARVPTPPGGLDLRAEPDPAAGGLRGMLYSNELLDAFPVERVRRRSGRLEQSWILARDGVLGEVFRDPPEPAVLEHLDRHGIVLREGQLAEVCLRVRPWFENVDRLLGAGGLLTIDYGHETATLYGPARPSGTLVTMRRFELGDDPLERPGERDLTAHVDFGALRRIGADRGFRAQGPCSLRVFLIGMGAAGLAAAGEAERLALRHLLVSEVGEQHKVLLQLKNLDPAAVPFGRERLRDPRS